MYILLFNQMWNGMVSGTAQDSPFPVQVSILGNINNGIRICTTLNQLHKKIIFVCHSMNYRAFESIDDAWLGGLWAMTHTIYTKAKHFKHHNSKPICIQFKRSCLNNTVHPLDAQICVQKCLTYKQVTHSLCLEWKRH